MITTQQNPKLEIPLKLSVIITVNNDVPALQLRKCITDRDLIKLIVSSAYHERPIIAIPTFKDKIRALSSLLDKGIIYRKDNEYFFV